MRLATDYRVRRLHRRVTVVAVLISTSLSGLTTMPTTPIRRRYVVDRTHGEGSTEKAFPDASSDNCNGGGWH